MRKRKLKISLHRIRETKELRMVLHIRVYRKEERNFTALLQIFQSGQLIFRQIIDGFGKLL